MMSLDLTILQLVCIKFISNLLNSSCYPQVFKYILASDLFKNKQFYTSCLSICNTAATLLAGVISILLTNFYKF